LPTIKCDDDIFDAEATRCGGRLPGIEQGSADELGMTLALFLRDRANAFAAARDELAISDDPDLRAFGERAQL
jgi:hypothetical protein